MQQLWIVPIFEPVLLQGPQIIGVAEFSAEVLKDLPVTLRRRAVDLAPDFRDIILLRFIIVEQRIVYVEQKNDGILHGNSCLNFPAVRPKNGSPLAPTMPRKLSAF
jgi:hypothetical protein